MRDPSASLRRDHRGVVYVEFLLVFPPLFLLFLVILQAAILRATDLGVTHAASATVRSAIVVLPDDPIAYAGQIENRIDDDDSCSSGFIGKLHRLLGKVGINTMAVPADGKCLGGNRMEAIRFAAIMRMLPFSPNAGSILPKRLTGAFDGLGMAGWVAGAALYSYGATSVTFPAFQGSEKLRPLNTFSREGEPLTVRVSYLAHCGIPLARFLMCDSRADLQRKKSAGAAGASMADTLAKGSGSTAILTGLFLSGQRFRVLRADATLPLNSALYRYQEK